MSNPFIAVSTSFVNQESFQITSCEPYLLGGSKEEDRPEDIPRFVGSRTVGVRMADRRIIPQTHQFVIEADSIVDAFAKFEESWDKYMKERQQASRISIPSAAETAKIITP